MVDPVLSKPTGVGTHGLKAPLAAKAADDPMGEAEGGVPIYGSNS